MVEEKRSAGVTILLSIVTLGIYGFFFCHSLAKDMNRVCFNDGEETPDITTYIVFTIITLGIYPYYWYYKVGQRQAANSHRYGLMIQENGTTVLVWMILGNILLGIGTFVGMYILIKNMNLMAHEYNVRHGYYGGGNQNGGSYGYAPANSGTVKVYCRSGEYAGRTFTLRMNENLIFGRDRSCNVRFSAATPNVSRRHCMLTYDGGIWLTDIGSTYGTFLGNKTRLAPNQRYAIQSGTEFYVGSTQVCFSVM